MNLDDFPLGISALTVRRAKLKSQISVKPVCSRGTRLGGNDGRAGRKTLRDRRQIENCELRLQYGPGPARGAGGPSAGNEQQIGGADDIRDGPQAITSRRRRRDANTAAWPTWR